MGKKVLIVDDEIHVIKILQFKLKNEGFEVLQALNGPDAIELAKAQAPDVILLDIMMPGMNGYEVYEALKEDDRTSEIPIVMVSAKTREADKSKAEDLGIEEYVYKPFSLQNIVDVINRVLL